MLTKSPVMSWWLIQGWTLPSPDPPLYPCTTCNLHEMSKAAIVVVLLSSHFCGRSLHWLTTPTESPTRHLMCGGFRSYSHLWENPSENFRATPLVSRFFFSSLFPCLSSLNLSSSSCSVARPVLFSALLITVPFSCQETAYDEDMRRGKEHLLNHHVLNI